MNANAAVVGADGSEEAPWPTISQALAAAPDGAVIRIGSGEYSQALRITRPVSLVGTCPPHVRLTGGVEADTRWWDRTFQTGVEIRGTAGVRLENLSLSTPQVAITVSNAQDVELANIHVEKALGMGVFLLTSDVTLRDVTVENVLGSNFDDGPCVEIAGATVTWQGGVVRDCLNLPTAHGIRIRGAATVTLERVEVTAARYVGVRAEVASHLTMTGVVVGGVLPHSSNSPGDLLTTGVSLLGSTVVATDTEISDPQFGLHLFDSTAVVSQSRIDPTTHPTSAAMLLAPSPTFALPTRSSATFASVVTSFVAVVGSDFEASDSLIGGSAQAGVSARDDATIALRGCRLHDNDLAGVAVTGGSLSIGESVLEGSETGGGAQVLIIGRDGASIDVGGSVLRGPSPSVAAIDAELTVRASALLAGRLGGVDLGPGAGGSGPQVVYGLGALRSTVTLADTSVAGEVDTGVLVEDGTTMRLERSVIRDTARADALWGVGLYCGSSRCTLDESLVESTSRAGIYAIDPGAELHLASTAVRDVVEQGTTDDPVPAADGVVLHAGTVAHITDSEIRSCGRAGVLADAAIPAQHDEPTVLNLSRTVVRDTAFSVVLQGGADYNSTQDNDLNHDPRGDPELSLDGEAPEPIDPDALFDPKDGP